MAQLVSEHSNDWFPSLTFVSPPLVFVSASSTMAFSMPSKPSIPMVRANSPFISCRRGSAVVACCTTTQQSQQQASVQQEQGILCDPCHGRGWLICDFCKGEKTNVKAPNNRIYRRCPTCRAVGYVLCSQCKVYKCVTFPDYEDGEL